MDTYFVEKMSEDYVKRKACWIMEEARKETTHPRVCRMTACD